MARLIQRGEFASIRNSVVIPTYGGRLQPQDTAYLEHAGGRWHSLDALLDIFRDAHTGSVAQQRISAVIGREWKLKEGGESAIDLKARDLCQAQLEALDIPTIEDDDAAIYSLNTGLDAACTNLLWATFFGMSASEAVWDQQGKEVILQDLQSRDVRRFAWVAGEKRGFKLRLLTPENPYDGLEVPARKFLIHRHFALPLEDPYGVGIASRLFYPVFYKRHAIKFWLIFAEKWASPTAIAKHPTNASDQQVNDLLEMINAIASDTGVAIPDTVSLDFLKSPGGAIDSYDGLKDFCNEEISKIVIGQTATVDQSQGGGSRARDQVADGIRVELAKSDSDMLSSTVNRLLAWMTWANFGPDAKPPKLWREFPELESKVNRSEEGSLISMLTNAGFKPTKEWVEKRLDIEIEDEQDPGAPKNPDTPPDIGSLLGGDEAAIEPDAEPTPAPEDGAIEPPPDFGELEVNGASQVLLWHGLSIGIEVMPGEARWKGTDHERVLTSAYGYVFLHLGSDDEGLDCYVSPSVLEGGSSEYRIFLVSQLDADGEFDEEKLMIGYADEAAARSAYLKEMPRQFFGDIVEIELDDLDNFKVDFAKTQKNCKRGYSCGFSCIRTAYQCRSPLKGQARTYADYLVGAVKRLGLSNMPQKHAADARAMGLGHPDDMPVKKERKPKQARQPKPKVPEAPKRSEVKPDYEKIDRHVVEYRQNLQKLQDLRASKTGMDESAYYKKLDDIDIKLTASFKAIDSEMGAYRESLLKSGMSKDDADKAAATVRIHGVGKSRGESLRSSLSEFYQISNGGGSDTIKTIRNDHPRAYSIIEAGVVNIGRGVSTDRSRLFHEVAHLAETDSIRISNNSWILSKSEDGKLYPLRELTGQSYRASEVAFKDSFATPYVGKSYGGTRNPTEVLSVGLEHFASKENMTTLYLRDSSHFKRMETYLNDRRNPNAAI
jgi:phage gp29-like protein